jgi:hypothetical protein
MTRLGDDQERQRQAARLDMPGRDLGEWERVWRENRTFPISSHRARFIGGIVVATKRLLRRAGRMLQADLWERQRAFNLVELEILRDLEASVGSLQKDVARVGGDLQQVQREILADVRRIQSELNVEVRRLSGELDDFKRLGLVDVMGHTDALFARLDQKVDRLRRLVEELGATSDGRSRSD